MRLGQLGLAGALTLSLSMVSVAQGESFDHVIATMGEFDDPVAFRQALIQKVNQMDPNDVPDLVREHLSSPGEVLKEAGDDHQSLDRVPFLLTSSGGGALEPSAEHPFGQLNPKAPPETAHWGQLAGAWDCSLTIRDEDGNVTLRKATWTWAYILDGYAVQDT